MITDACKHVRELGVRRILRARASKQPQRGVRIFEIPLINCEAEDYVKLTDWQQCKLTELPLSKSISDLYLEGFVHGGETPVIEFARFPCHTQAVERCVKGVTESILSCSVLKSTILTSGNSQSILSNSTTGSFSQFVPPSSYSDKCLKGGSLACSIKTSHCTGRLKCCSLSAQ